MKIQDRRLRPVFGWDSPLHGRQDWRFGYVDSLLYNRLCVTLAPSGVYINRRVLVRRTTYNHTIDKLLGFSLSDLVVDQLL